LSRQNILLEFTSSKPELVDRLEKAFEKSWAWIVEFGREGDKVRVLSEFGEIKDVIFKNFKQEELKEIPYKVIPFEEEEK